MIKLDSIWRSSDSTEFVVISVTECQDGHTWVHYRNAQGQEFSCYEESFLQRFTENVNRRYQHRL